MLGASAFGGTPFGGHFVSGEEEAPGPVTPPVVEEEGEHGPEPVTPPVIEEEAEPPGPGPGPGPGPEPSPGPEPVAGLGPLPEELLGELPPILRGSRDYQAIMQAAGRESERAQNALELVRRQFFPDMADLLLAVWERIVKQTQNPPLTLSQRQEAVLARLRRMTGGDTGREWERTVTELIGPGWSYEEHTGDPESPPANTLLISLPFAAGSSRYLEAVRLIAEVTPAHLMIEYATEGGFLLDASEMDVDTLVV